MKKFTSLLLVLCLSFVPGKLCAQDELWHKENFSLSKRSEVQSQIYIPETRLEIGEGTSPSLAEIYLRRLAVQSEERRKKKGYLSLAGGGILTFIGILLYTKEPEGWLDFSQGFGAFFLICGGLAAGTGILYASIPSGAEREFKKLQNISDSEQRERMCGDALSSLAAKARRGRIVMGILSSALGAYILARSLREEEPGSSWTPAALLGALALRDFLRKSPSEKAYRDYLEENQRQKKLSFGIGLGRRGGMRMGLSLSY